MKKIVLLISLIVLLSSCGDKTQEVVIEEGVLTGSIEVDGMLNEEVTVSGSIDEENAEQIEVDEEDSVEANSSQDTTTNNVVEEKKSVDTTPVIKTETVNENENSSSEKEPDHEPTTPIVDDGTDELIDDMIGDIDDIFKEIESEG